MRGGAQSHLMLDSDKQLWVVKFQNNPQHNRVLANEFLATRIAAAVGLTVPESAVVEVSEWLIGQTPEMEMDLGLTRVRCMAGRQFGSRFVGGLMPGKVMDFLPDQQLAEVNNLAEFAGILALDKWTGNIDGRQAVFSRRTRERRYNATFIDHGHCFHAGDWTLVDGPLHGVYPRNTVYQEVTGWESFEPWLTNIETMEPWAVRQIAAEIPKEWYSGDSTELDSLVEKLLKRRGRIRDLIVQFGRSDRAPFPKWMRSERRLQK
ncbi:HipA family kinase [Acidicapsa acidisoli]|uniref:HipA family kinase n=1 Tax=Acidicapsa acidisoli TaxID=1615681 RepID=UPI00295B586D|nr:HipA family kinase [Acidicapsa acidisoli]